MQPLSLGRALFLILVVIVVCVASGQGTLTQPLAALALTLLVTKMEGGRFRDLQWSRPHLLMCGALLGLVGALSVLLMAGLTENIEWSAVQNVSSLALLKTGLIFLLLSFAEELVHRGLIFRVLSRAADWRWAVVVSATIFAAVYGFHGSLGRIGPVGIATVFMLGGLLCLLYIGTCSLWTPIGFNFAWNLVLELASEVAPGFVRASAPSFYGVEGWPITLVVFALGLPFALRWAVRVIIQRQHNVDKLGLAS